MSIAQASKIFGELCNSARDLSIETKRLVYQSVVLGILLYSAETWAPTQVLVKKRDTPIVAILDALWILDVLYSGQSISSLLNWLNILVCQSLLVFC